MKNIFFKYENDVSYLLHGIHDSSNLLVMVCTVEPLLRGHPDERPTPLERPLDTVNLNINVLISTPDKRPPLLKGHFSDANGSASQEGFHSRTYSSTLISLLFSRYHSFNWNLWINNKEIRVYQGSQIIRKYFNIYVKYFDKIAINHSIKVSMWSMIKYNDCSNF